MFICLLDDSKQMTDFIGMGVVTMTLLVLCGNTVERMIETSEVRMLQFKNKND